MYSPKISEDLVRKLYPIAKQKHMPMTRLVNQIIHAAVDQIEKNTNNSIVIHDIQVGVKSDIAA
jgi:hypothetical protein